MQITIEKTGRRFYIRNTPYSAKDQIKAAGCRWDPEARAWWTGKSEVAESLARELGQSPDASKPGTIVGRPRKMADGRWGAFLPGAKGEAISIGTEITVRASNGKSWTASVAAVVVEREDGVEVYTSQRSSDRPASHSRGSSRGGGFGVRRPWRPCGYPGCNPRYCDECDGEGR